MSDRMKTRFVIGDKVWITFEREGLFRVAEVAIQGIALSDSSQPRYSFKAHTQERLEGYVYSSKGEAISRALQENQERFDKNKKGLDEGDTFYVDWVR